MSQLVDIGPALLAAFLGSLVEAVEALTIVLAVGTVRGWRSALTGAGAGFVVLILAVALFGPLLALVPIGKLQLVVGVLLLLFGMRWLRKAILRSAGRIALHDETRIYTETEASMRRDGTDLRRRLDPVAVATTFKAVVLEGVEVVFIVIAVGSVGDALVPAGLGAAAACLLVTALGFAVHRPLARVPENTLKFAVGILLSSFGAFWTAEGLGFAWPGGDLAIPGIAILFLATALAAVALARRAGPSPVRSSLKPDKAEMSALKTAMSEFIGLFMDDGRLAAGIVLTVAAAALLLPLFPLSTQEQSVILLVALLAAIV